jgi:hypothetical protein
MKYLLVLFPLVLFSCTNFQQYQLAQTNPHNSKLALGKMPSAKALLLNGDGLIDDFSQPPLLWESDSSNLFVDIYNGELFVKAENTGPHFEFFYRKYNPLDFSDVGTIQMNFTSSDVKEPFIVLQLLDENENKANIAPIVKNGNTLVYPFSSTETTPEFNLSRVTEIRFFIEPGDSLFSGKIFLDNIRALK